MINNLNPLLNNLNKKQQNNTDNIKNKSKTKINYKEENISNKDFSILFNDILYENLIDEFINYEPEELIKEIIKKGNDFLSNRNEDTLEEYKHFLGGFLALTINKSLRLKIIKDKKKFNEISEKYYLLVNTINEKYLALLNSFLLSQQQIFKVIKEIEGILLNIKI
ncbi:MAG: DUF327 family protein [Spirochaetes bacterium]|nr:DUF327 family protein [Spirochaetota bacterium]